ncbi:MAG: DNA-directed RNA polymerase [Asgard group archaeon]|nr:DNA-directed RNA polymerase [Asgard group archaeon]
MFKITCSECGREAEVPFKPDGVRPVYCQDCYKSKRKPRGKRNFRPRQQ